MDVHWLWAGCRRGRIYLMPAGSGAHPLSGYTMFRPPRIPDRMHRSIPLIRAARAALLLAFAACGDTTRKPEAPARTVSAPTFVKADVDFMQGMIMHHGQAIVMAALAPSNGARADVQLLAEKISVSQKDEIRMMQTWLADRRQASMDPNHDMGGMLMPGMLTKE